MKVSSIHLADVHQFLCLIDLQKSQSRHQIFGKTKMSVRKKL